MGFSFLGALGHGGSGFVDGMQAYEANQRSQLENEARQRALDTETAYGNTLGGGAQGAQPWDQQRNSIWQRIGQMFQGGQAPQNDPMGATALPEGVQSALPPTMGQQNMFEQIGAMGQQQGLPGFSAMPQGMPQGAPQGMSAGPQAMPQSSAPPQMASPQGAPQQITNPQAALPSIIGRMNIQEIGQRVRAANPGAPPHVIAGAVDRFRPWMNDEAKVQWQLAQMELRQQAEGRRQEQGDERLAQGGQRLELSQQQAGVRERQGDERLRIQQQGANTRERSQQDLGNYRQARLGQLGEQLDLRRQEIQNRSERALQRVQEARSEKDRAAAIREYEQAWREYSSTASRMVTAANIVDQKQRKAVLDQLNADRESAMARLEPFRTGTAQPYQQTNRIPAAGGAGLTPNDPEMERAIQRSPAAQRAIASEPARVVPGTKNPARVIPMTPQQPAPAAAPQADPPPQVLQTLKPGVITTFGNGQKWTIQDGKPVKVQ